MVPEFDAAARRSRWSRGHERRVFTRLAVSRRPGSSRWSSGASRRASGRAGGPRDRPRSAEISRDQPRLGERGGGRAGRRQRERRRGGAVDAAAKARATVRQGVGRADKVLSRRRRRRVALVGLRGGRGEESSVDHADGSAGASLSSLYEEARRGAGKTIDDHYADNVARAGRKYKGPASADDEYDNDGGVEMRASRPSQEGVSRTGPRHVHAPTGTSLASAASRTRKGSRRRRRSRHRLPRRFLDAS